MPIDWGLLLDRVSFGAGPGGARDPVAIRYWQVRPLGALWPMLVGIALLFSILPLIGDLAVPGRSPAWNIAAHVGLVCAFASSLFWASIRQRRGRALVIVVVFIAGLWLLDALAGPEAPSAIADPAVRRRLRVDAFLVAAAVAGSYSLFTYFVFSESGAFARLRGDVDAAALIHARLVPPIDATWPGWQAHGRSTASHDMGGDLLDVLPASGDRPDAWTAYVADVSGHGVAAGVFMGVVKTALRMALRQHAEVADALAAANAVIHEQKRREMFATVALVRGAGDGRVRVTVAGHVPVLHWSARTGRTTPIVQRQLPLGVLRASPFSEASAECAPGDLLVLLSDGLTEVFDRSREELGLEAIAACVDACGHEPLPDVYARLVALARCHGPIRDDETVLLLRHTGSPA